MRILSIIIIGFVICACGSQKVEVNEPPADEEEVEVKYSAEDFVSRASLERAELTTAVDEKRFRAAAPVTTQFDPSDKIIYLVGRLKSVPTDATIEVHWFLDSDPRPMLVSSIQGSDSFQFVSAFSSADGRFIVGTYSARVLVNERDVGGISFVIGNPDTTSNALVSNVAFSTAVTGDMKPKKPSKKFGKGTRKLYVTFDVKGAQPDSEADVIWYRGVESFHSSSLALGQNRRYGAHVESSGGLPDGEYRVEVHVGSSMAADEKVIIGDKTGGTPSVDSIEFGLVLKDNNMPKKAMTVFKRNTPVIQCGFRFIDLPPGSVIEVRWMKVESDGDELFYKNASNLSTGGSGTMGAPWEPGYELAPGTYKAAIAVNDEVLAEESFRIE